MSQINLKLEPAFESLCAELGLDIESAFRIYMTAAVRKKGIPFFLEVSNDWEYTSTSKSQTTDETSMYGEKTKVDLPQKTEKKKRTYRTARSRKNMDTRNSKKILEHLQSHESIVNKDVRELTELSNPDARKLLQKLVSDGVLTTIGKGNATKYVLINTTE